MEVREYYNLDTNVKLFFTNTRVLNVLSRSNIETLWDLYSSGEDFISKSNNIGTLSREIIHEAYKYLKNLYNLELDYVKVYKKLKPYLKRKILVSANSDNQYLSEVIKATKLIANHYKSLGFDAVNIINASGKEAEQCVFHLHFHIIPRKNNDGLKVFPSLPGENEDLDKQYQKLKMI